MKYIFILLFFSYSKESLAQVSPSILAQLPGRPVEKKFPANQEGDFHSGILVQKGDFIYIEANGEAEISEVYGTKVDATGSTGPIFNSFFNRYKGYWHAALLCKINNNIVNQFSWSIFEMVPRMQRLAVEGIGFFRARGDVPGVLFLAPESGEVNFEINDTKIKDNKGYFYLSIYKLSQKQHRQRNIYNQCPITADQAIELGDFESDGIGTFFYHTDPNQDIGDRIDITGYRGVGKYYGCQCIYNKEGGLVNKGVYMGTFDYALARPELRSSRFMHYILDVIPHIMYRGNLGITDDEMYQPTPAKNIIRIP